MALEDGTTAPLMMLFPYRSDPATGSLIPSMSTGGAAMNATINAIVAASKVGIIRVPNQPTYKSRLSVEVTQLAYFCHSDDCRIEIVNDAVI